MYELTVIYTVWINNSIQLTQQWRKIERFFSKSFSYIFRSQQHNQIIRDNELSSLQGNNSFIYLSRKIFK